MCTFKLYWSPTGQHIATVTASDPRNAVRKAPKPYRKYLGEIHADEVRSHGMTDFETNMQLMDAIDSDIACLRRDIAQHNAHDRTR